MLVNGTCSYIQTWYGFFGLKNSNWSLTVQNHPLTLNKAINDHQRISYNLWNYLKKLLF